MDLITNDDGLKLTDADCGAVNQNIYIPKVYNHTPKVDIYAHKKRKECFEAADV